MNIWELLLTAIGLSMDAFAVSVCKGLSVGRATKKQMALTGAWFGGFQGLMPLIGYFIGKSIASLITSFDHWIAFALLAFIGLNMIKESFSNEESCTDCSFAARVMVVMAIATSIDALAVGVSLKTAEIAQGLALGAWGSTITIGVITMILSVGAVYIGKAMGDKLADKAGVFGGAVLLLIGLKILIESFL